MNSDFDERPENHWCLMVKWPSTNSNAFRSGHYLRAVGTYQDMVIQNLAISTQRRNAISVITVSRYNLQTNLYL